MLYSFYSLSNLAIRYGSAIAEIKVVLETKHVFSLGLVPVQIYMIFLGMCKSILSFLTRFIRR